MGDICVHDLCVPRLLWKYVFRCIHLIKVYFLIDNILAY